MRRPHPCPNCGVPLRSAKALVRHLLEEAGARGVTTAQFVQAGCGARFGGRIYDLRHDDGLVIHERRLHDSGSIYFLVPAVSSAPAPPHPAAAAPSPAAAHQEPGYSPPAEVPTAHSGAGADEITGRLFEVPTRQPGNALTEEAA